MFNRDTRAMPPLPNAGASAQRLSGPTGIVGNPGQSMQTGSDRPTSILGPDISIFGEHLTLKTKGSLLIQGQIEGDVHGESVTVDTNANVKGVITARAIAIKGSHRGALKGSNVILHENSTVDADITQQNLTVAEGANFEGTVRRARDVSDVTPDLS